LKKLIHKTSLTLPKDGVGLFAVIIFLKNVKKIENSLCDLAFNYISFLSYRDKGKALFKGFVCKLKF